jgi:hypothetical protein
MGFERPLIKKLFQASTVKRIRPRQPGSGLARAVPFADRVGKRTKSALQNGRAGPSQTLAQGSGKHTRLLMICETFGLYQSA